MQDEMPGFFPGRPGGEHDEPLLDMILERSPIPPGAPPEIHGLARMLAAVAGPAEPGDLPGQAAALAAFTRLASPPGTSPAALRSARSSLPGRPARGRLPLAAALAAAAAGLGSTAAAYADVLPSPVQHFAHVAFGAPAPSHGFILHAPAVTSSPTYRHPDIRPSTPARRHSAALSDPVSDKAHPGPWHDHGRKGNGVGPGYASCVPMLPTRRDQGRAVGHSQNPARPSPAQDTPSPGFSPPGWLVAPTTACPPGTDPKKAAHARGR
jgi:hypothetical protein